MRTPWNRGDFERRLRDHRAEPRDEFVASVADSVGSRRRARTGFRPALALAMTVTVMMVMGALGGVGYASSAAHHVAATVQHAISAPSHAVVNHSVTSADHQYCHGDDCHHHHHHHHHHCRDADHNGDDCDTGHHHHHHHHHHCKHHHHTG